MWGKIRLSPSGYPLSTEDFCRLLLDAGADNICVHGRTPAQRYEGVADSGEVERIAGLFPGYISASGDVFSPEDAVRYCRAGCVGVMVARGAMRDPFMIPAAVAALDDRSRNDAPSVDPWQPRWAQIEQALRGAGVSGDGPAILKAAGGLIEAEFTHPQQITDDQARASSRVRASTVASNSSRSVCASHRVSSVTLTPPRLGR